MKQFLHSSEVGVCVCVILPRQRRVGVVPEDLLFFFFLTSSIYQVSNLCLRPAKQPLLKTMAAAVKTRVSTSHQCSIFFLKGKQVRLTLIILKLVATKHSQICSKLCSILSIEYFPSLFQPNAVRPLASPVIRAGAPYSEATVLLQRSRAFVVCHPPFCMP